VRGEPPLLLRPVENENSDLLIIRLLGRGDWDGLSPFTVLTISHLRSISQATVLHVSSLTAVSALRKTP